MKVLLGLSALALLSGPAAAIDVDPAGDCSADPFSWVVLCTRAASNCCYFAAEQTNTTCPMTRAKHYILQGRCRSLYTDSAIPYNKTDCITATLSGIALLMGDLGLGFQCTIDDVKDMP